MFTILLLAFIACEEKSEDSALPVEEEDSALTVE